MAKLFTRTAETVHSDQSYDLRLPEGDPALVNQPDYIAARTRDYIDYVVLQALASDDWTFEPVTGEAIASFLATNPIWKAEAPNYFKLNKTKILKAVYEALVVIQTQMNLGKVPVVVTAAERRIKKHLTFKGFDIGLEYLEGDIRRGTAPNGFKWEREVVGNYGRFKDLMDSADGESMDVWLGDDETSDHVYIVNQLKEDGQFDEHKILLGFPTAHAALIGYLSNMPDDWTRFDPLKTLSLAEFRRWAQTGDGQRKVAATTFDGYCPICGSAGCRGECAPGRKRASASENPWPEVWINREGVPEAPNVEQEDDDGLLKMVHAGGEIHLTWNFHLTGPQLMTSQFFIESDPRWSAKVLNWAGSGISGAMDPEEFIDLTHPADVYDAHVPPAPKLAAQGSAVLEEEHNYTPVDIKKLVTEVAEAHPLPAPVDPTQTPEFASWFGASVVKDASGKPKRVFHGTTHEFDQFKVTGNEEGHYGKAIYFTSSPRDVNQNYAKPDGPDITSRIERRAEDLMQELEYDDEWAGAFPEYGTAEYKKLEATVHERARREIAGQNQGTVYVTYLRIEKPVYVQPGGGTKFQLISERTGQETGMMSRLNRAVMTACGGEFSYGQRTGQHVWDAITSDWNEYLTAYELEQAIRRCDDVYDYPGGPGPLVAKVYQLMGFDGIIQDATAEFRNMMLEPGTTHYIVWNPRQVKSALGNSGAFNRRSPRLVASSNFESWFAGSKIVDAQGHPLKCIHGTTHDFDKFKESSDGIWFSTVEDTTGAEEALLNSGEDLVEGIDPDETSFPKGGRMVPVYLKVKNPKVMDWGYPDCLKLQEEGYDGVIYYNSLRQMECVVVFHPTQIKSAITSGFTQDDTRITAAIEYDLHDGQQRTIHFKIQGQAGPSFEVYAVPQTDGDVEGEVHSIAPDGQRNHGTKPFLPFAQHQGTPLATAQKFMDEVWACMIQEYKELYNARLQAGDRPGAQAIAAEAQAKRQEVLNDIVGSLVPVPAPKYRPGIQAALKLARPADATLLKKLPGLTPELLAEAQKVDNDRYLEWVCAQAVSGQIVLPDNAEVLRQGLRTFNILRKDPAFTGSKDIRKYEPSEIAGLNREATPEHTGLIDKLISEAPTFDDLYTYLEQNYNPVQLRDLLQGIGGAPRLRQRWDKVHGEDPDQPFSLEDKRISPRKPQTKKEGAGEDPNGPIKLQPEIRAWAKKPEALERAVQVFQSYPGFSHIKKGKLEVKTKAILDQLTDNLVWLYNQVPPAQRERSKMWYTGGNRLVHRWARQFALDPHKVAGVIAVLSPQRDWFQNISLAERVMDAYLHHRNDVWTPEMTQAVNDWVKAANDEKAKVRERLERKRLREAEAAKTKRKRPAKAAADEEPEEVEEVEGEDQEFAKGEDPEAMLKLIPLCEGKTLAEVQHDPDLCALWIRAFDQAHNRRNYRIVSPEGEFGDWARRADFETAMATWSSLAFIWKAVDVINSPSIEHISDIIGENHKVRSFYNNLIAPYSKGGDVTIDTHAVAAALIRPLAGSSREVNNNFGTTKTGDTLVKPTKDAVGGNTGTYAIYADAYRQAAKRVGVSPREMQSITWEAVRTLFKPTQKNDKDLRKTIITAWENVSRGKSTAEQARNTIRDAAKGFEAPAWAGPHYQPPDYSRHSSYKGELPAHGGPGGGPEGPGRGTGSVTSSRAAAPGRRVARLFQKTGRFLTLAEVRAGAIDPEIGSGDYAATTHGQFWGSAGAGVIFRAQDTGRLLVAYRSTFVNEPHTWGVWGGAFEHGEVPEHAASREAREETGYTGRMSLEQVFVFKKDDFTYTTFLAHVPEEFTPHLDWETEGWRWVEPGDWPTPVHYGLQAAIPGILAKLGPDRPTPPPGEKRARLFIKERPQIKGDILVTVDVAKVEANISRDPNMYVGPGGTGAAIGDRYPRFQQWLADNPETPVKVSDLGWNPATKMVVFGNGRHRWAVLRDQGATRIAVTVPSYDLGIFQKLFDAQVVEGGQHVAATDPLAAAIKRVYKGEPLWDILHNYGPFDGGCLICAKALILAAGSGSLMRIVRAEGGADGPDQTEHYGAKINGAIYDFAGKFTSPAAWVHHFAEVEAMYTGDNGEPITLYVAEGLQPGYRPALDAPDLPEQSQAIAELLVQAMKGRTARLFTKTASIDVHKAWANMVLDRGPEFAADITERAQKLIDHANGRIAQDQPKGYEEETERINARSKTPEARRAHKFEPATWTFPNGHPRCRICGDEEQVGGMCPGRKTASWTPPDYERMKQWVNCSPQLYAKAVARLQALAFPLTLYRAVKIPSEAELRHEQAGIYWTDQLDRAQFWTPAGRQAPGEKFVLRTEVGPEAIDWSATFAANCEPQGNTGTKEKEIKLNQGTRVVVNGIMGPKDTDFKVRKLPVTASVTKTASMGDITREEWAQMTYEGTTRDSIRRNLPDYGFNVNDDERPWTQMILKRQKTVETRNSPSLSAHVGETVAIIRTKKGEQAQVVGTCVLGQPKVYQDNAAFRADAQAHQVPAGGGYDLAPGAVKYGYPVSQVKACAPFPVTAQGRVWRRLTQKTGSSLQKTARLFQN